MEYTPKTDGCIVDITNAIDHSLQTREDIHKYDDIYPPFYHIAETQNDHQTDATA